MDRNVEVIEKKYEIERGFISKLLETKNMSTVKDMRIKSSYMFGEHKKAFNFISEFFIKYGNVPTIKIFKQRFPRYELEKYINPDLDNELVTGTEENLTFWCDELRRKVKHNKIAEIVEESAEKLEQMDTEEAYSVMKKGILQVESEIVDSTTVNITEDVDDRKKLYEERKLNKGIIGIPTGIEKLDFLIKGLQRKTLVTLIAKTGTGKTWLEVILGSHACLNNFRVLQFVTEMSEEQMRDRYEAVLIGKLLGEFNYTRFKSGLLSAKEEDKYYEFLDKHLPRLEPLFIETADGVSSVASKIQQHSPDLVLIDSAYLMEDERNAKDDWLRVAHISRDLKLLCKRAEVPIFINTQADSTTSKKTGPELENIAFAKSIGQDSDIVAALFQDDQMREDKEMKLKILKQREGCLGSVMLNWDLTKMNFNSIYSTVEQEVDNSDNNGFEQPAGLIEMEDEE